MSQVERKAYMQARGIRRLIYALCAEYFPGYNEVTMMPQARYLSLG